MTVQLGKKVKSIQLNGVGNGAAMMFTDALETSCLQYFPNLEKFDRAIPTGLSKANYVDLANYCTNLTKFCDSLETNHYRWLSSLASCSNLNI